MILKKVIEAEHSKKQCMKVVAYVGSSQTRFKELVEVFLTGPYRVSQRAAWPLTICVQHHPDIVNPHLSKLLSMLVKPDQHAAVRRNILRLLQFVTIPKRFHGKLLNICFGFLTSHTEPVAIKVFSMSVILDIIKNSGSPELGRELEIILEEQLPFASAAYRSRAFKTLRELKRLNGR